MPIYQVSEERGVPFLAMPLLRGKTLQDRLAEETGLSLAEILRIGREAAEGLAAAHGHGLVHRDIKPGNMWLEEPRRAGQTPRLRARPVRRRRSGRHALGRDPGHAGVHVA